MLKNKNKMILKKLDVMPFLLIGLSIITIYGKAMFFEFTTFDDTRLIFKNSESYGKLSNFSKIFSKDVYQDGTGLYRPMLNVSIMLDKLITNNPWIFHLDNILIHFIATCLVFLILSGLGADREIAMALSILFAIHPVLVQSVAWIPGRNDSLLGLFLFAATYAIIKYLNQGKFYQYFMHLFFYAAALFTKESAIILPLLILFMTYYKMKTWRNGIYLNLLFGWGMITLVWYLFRKNAIGAGINLMIWNSPIENILGFAGYFGKLLIPAGLSPIAMPHYSMIIYGFIFSAAMISISIIWGIRNKLLFVFGLLWLALFLSPYLVRWVFFPNFLEHRLYVPMLGFMIILSELKFFNSGIISRKMTLIISVLSLLIFLFVSMSYAEVFRNRSTLWREVVRTSPDYSFGHYNVGLIEASEGNYSKAEDQFREALRLYPELHDANSQLGLIYFKKGELTKARTELIKAIAIAPNIGRHQYRMGLVFWHQGNIDSANAYFSKASMLEPNTPQYRYSIGLICQQKGEINNAISIYLDLIDKNPRYLPALIALGKLYINAGQEKKGNEYLTRAKSYNPSGNQ